MLLVITNLIRNKKLSQTNQAIESREAYRSRNLKSFSPLDENPRIDRCLPDWKRKGKTNLPFNIAFGNLKSIPLFLHEQREAWSDEIKQFL